MYQAEDKKYGGWNDSLDYKMDMYKDICDIYQCPIDRRMDSSLERASLRAHRHDVGMTFEGIINHFRDCCEGIDFKRSELQAWHMISYELNKEQNQNKSPSECVVILVDALNAKRCSLDPSQRTDDAIHTRQTNACWGISEFQSSLSAPSSHLPTFINQLKMAVRFQSSYRRKGIHTKVSSNDDRKLNGTGNGLFKFDNKCYVRGKENCRALKHDRDQRLNARKRWENRSHTYIIESLDAQDAESENESTDVYIAEAFSEMNFNFES
ncbi:hypothetical protein OnM2_009011 [Erysiphe neolycopersici]|uniref:Uncharacterized protein n=1 Tax=Erysiphe neolycopersici TaxID=212602 RepID=A0A420I6L4_9PEZI|nr:hypothetical protein OnM2_009011 [Erysiphe neolycopersici]